MLRWLFKSEPAPASNPALLRSFLDLREKVERKNISFPFDDRDVGYDMAIDEVLELIDDAINKITSGNDVDYSGGI